MPPKSNTVKYEVRDRNAWVTLNRPEALNALNNEIRQAIEEAITEAIADDNVLVVIMIGEGGRAFCAGNDLVMQAARDAGTSVNYAGLGAMAVAYCPKPVIAAIDGYCLAGGMQLSARCDMRIATEKSRFGMPEARRSLMAVEGIDTPDQFFPPGEARWILLTGSHMTAQRAFQLGFIQALVPDREALVKEAERLASEIKLCAPLAVRGIKQILAIGQESPMPADGGLPFSPAQKKLIQATREQVEKSEDRKEGPKAFAEKRTPNWKMR